MKTRDISVTEEHNDIENKPRNFFSRLTSALKGKKDVVKNNLVNLLKTNKIDKTTLEEIESELIMADIGVLTTEKIINLLTQVFFSQYFYGMMSKNYQRNIVKIFLILR